MRKRKVRGETLIKTEEIDDKEKEEEDEEGKGTGFFACYLLTSLCPRFKGHTYIGFTVNPRRRIRQHNGEIRSGAWRTKKKRPWEMVFCIFGFPTNVAALQFEWAWQHPVESLAVRKAAATFKSFSGVANKIKLAYTMLTLPAWQSLNLTVNFFSTKYKIHTAGCPTLPEQMRVHVCSMDDLPCYTGSNLHACDDEEWGGDEECDIRGTQESSEEGSIEATEKGQDSASNRYDIDGNDSKHMDQTEESTNQQNRCLEEIRVGQLINSPIGKGGANQSSFLDDSSLRFSSPFVNCVEDRHTPRLIGEFTDNTHQLPKEQSDTGLLNDKYQLHTKSSIPDHEVEIIDVFTPSPCYRISSESKKRRTAVYPEIIDLTESPIYV